MHEKLARMGDLAALFSPCPQAGQQSVTLSRCRWWQLDELGRVDMVRCPDHDHCLHMVRLVDGRIGEHTRNLPGRCAWIGIRVTDDRKR